MPLATAPGRRPAAKKPGTVYLRGGLVRNSASLAPSANSMLRDVAAQLIRPTLLLARDA